MNLWDKYQEFPPDFLAQHHDFVLYDVFHQIKALLLYPLNCSCRMNCICEATRTKIVFSLNVELYNKARMREENPDLLHVMRYLYKIPDDAYFRESYGEGYPLWLIEEKFLEKSNNNDFKIVGHLIWTLLALARTYELSPIHHVPQASLTEALDRILGKNPLKSKVGESYNETYLCGEKKYISHLNTYKSICHFIAAFQDSEQENPSFSFSDSDQIQEFLKLSNGVRQKLLQIQTPNIKKENCLFAEDSLLPLPTWVKMDDFDFPLEPFQDKLNEIKELIKNAQKISPSPRLTTATHLRR